MFVIRPVREYAKNRWNRISGSLTRWRLRLAVFVGAFPRSPLFPPFALAFAVLVAMYAAVSRAVPGAEYLGPRIWTLIGAAMPALYLMTVLFSKTAHQSVWPGHRRAVRA